MGLNSLYKNNYDNISNEELIKRFQNGEDEIKDYFFERNKALIYGIVKRFTKGKRDEDIYQIACLGFIKAFNNFNTQYDVKFSTYAVPIILGEIKKYFRDQGSIHITRSIKENHIKIMEAKSFLQQTLLRNPSIEELSAYTKLNIEDIVLSLNANQFVTSMDDVIYESDGHDITLLDISKDEKQIDIVLKTALDMEKDKLSKDEKLLLYYRYIENLKQNEISSILNMSQVQISRMEKKILLKLREKFKV